MKSVTWPYETMSHKTMISRGLWSWDHSLLGILVLETDQFLPSKRTTVQYKCNEPIFKLFDIGYTFFEAQYNVLQ